MEHYKVPDFHTALEFLSLLARRQGKLRKGGLPDTDKAAKSVLMDWTGYLKMSNCGNVTTWCWTTCLSELLMLFRGRISYFTHPPETHTLPTHVSAEIVSEMGKAFDWDELEKGNEEILAGKLKLGMTKITTKFSVYWILYWWFDSSFHSSSSAVQFHVGMTVRSLVKWFCFCRFSLKKQNLNFNTLCFRDDDVCWCPNGILHGKQWNDSGWPRWSASWLRATFKRRCWIHGRWAGPRGTNSPLLLDCDIFRLFAKKTKTLIHLLLTSTVWTNDCGDKISKVKKWHTCRWSCGQGSRADGCPAYRSSAAGSGPPGCQQEAEEATKKSRCVEVMQSVSYIVNVHTWPAHHLLMSPLVQNLELFISSRNLTFTFN